jgi:hypothetical protein
VSVGNGPSENPYHGWVFELDLDAWRAGSADDAVASVLCTTRENDCGPPGNRDQMRCGGGVWNPAGLVRYEEEDGSYGLLVPTGNGRVDYDVGAYAHSVLRVGRGLTFEPGCDNALCADFDELDPPHACLASCRDVFTARLMPGDPPLTPEDGSCDGLTFQQCYGVLDADLGASAPLLVDVPGGPRVMIQPGKDGALYLVDAAHMGTLYQRLVVMDICGTPTDPCRAVWIGAFVTQPVVANIDGTPVVMVASVMSDTTHPAGIIAVDLVMEGDEPRMRLRWQVPSFDTPDAVEMFRHHPGRPILVDVDGEPHVFVLETRRSGPGVTSSPPGVLWGVRVRDGFPAVQAPIRDAGQRFAVPLLYDDTLYLSSCRSRADGDGLIDAFRIRAR